MHPLPRAPVNARNTAETGRSGQNKLMSEGDGRSGWPCRISAEESPPRSFSSRQHPAECPGVDSDPVIAPTAKAGALHTVR